MYGAIVGDIAGSKTEFNPIKTEDFPLFSTGSKVTDDSVLTVATAEALMYGGGFAETYKKYCSMHPHRGWGSSFKKWAASGSLLPYNSFGNGSAMRVSPVAYFRDDEHAVVALARQTASVTHNHPEGIKGAEATAWAIWAALNGWNKEDIRTGVEAKWGYDLGRTVAGIRPTYRFNVTCQGSVPEAIICFLESTSYEDAIRKAISLGGDADTQACIAGSIAEAFYGGVPEDILSQARQLVPEELRVTADRYHTEHVEPRLKLRRAK